MESEQLEPLTPEKFAENLAAFAIDRNDLKDLIAALPEESQPNMTAIEYELALLKIISVGWGISFYMAATDKNKASISEHFWVCIREISNNISTLTQATAGQEIDYFEIIKSRLNTYLSVMQDNEQDQTNPAEVIGPAFADVCKCKDDAATILTGTKMFTMTLGSVKAYINATRIDNVKLN